MVTHIMYSDAIILLLRCLH